MSPILIVIICLLAVGLLLAIIRSETLFLLVALGVAVLLLLLGVIP